MPLEGDDKSKIFQPNLPRTHTLACARGDHLPELATGVAL
jgi:hypothetical protein